VTRRCAAEFPIYIADIIASALSGDGKRHSILVQNQGAVSSLPDDAFIQLTCGVTKDEIIRPNPELPEFIMATLSSRVYQNHILARALANQDEKLLRQALLSFPERVPFDKLSEIIASNNAEPYISLN
jgi:alpha-galactosidase/6-phospho-beta-glucosidase family protein